MASTNPGAKHSEHKGLAGLVSVVEASGTVYYDNAAQRLNAADELSKVRAHHAGEGKPARRYLLGIPRARTLARHGVLVRYGYRHGFLLWQPCSPRPYPAPVTAPSSRPRCSWRARSSARSSRSRSRQRRQHHSPPYTGLATICIDASIPSQRHSTTGPTLPSNCRPRAALELSRSVVLLAYPPPLRSKARSFARWSRKRRSRHVAAAAPRGRELLDSL